MSSTSTSTSESLSRFAVVALFGLACAWAAPVFAQTTAFYYGQSLPPELATAYEQVVVQPEHVADPAQIQRLGALPIAYFSVGELAPSQAKQISPSWQLARNDAWSSLVMNVADAGYHAFTLERFEKLWQAGYRGFFLDTLDSYQLGAKTDAARAEQQRGLVTLLRALKARHPDARLLINRGFELLPEIAPLVQGVVAESLFDRWEAAKRAYTRVPEADRTWLLERLNEVRSRYQLPVTVIDYRPSQERAAARETARRIAALGFEPWVCDGALSEVGIGRREILPRRVLILTDTPVKDGAALERGPLDWLAPILEYLGYFGELRSVHAGLPEEALVGRYAGVISWFDGASVPNGYGRWLLSQVRAGTHFALFGALGFDAGSAEARALGITPARIPADGQAAILGRDPLIGFEAEPPLHPIAGTGITLEGDDVHVHLQVADQAGQAAVAIATAAWGGIASSHVFGLRGLSGERAWALDPFAFLQRALQLPVMPVPDVTTENGRRLALFAIEPDGLSDRARLRGRPYTWSVLRSEVLSRYDWPHALPAADSGDADQSPALRALLQLPATYAASLPGGATDAGSGIGSLTRVQAMAQPGAGGLRIPAPIAWDSAFVPASGEGYAFERVLETLAYTDAPRRLKPLALHYHAYMASSPAGLGALARIYAWLGTQELLPIRAADYAARVQAFRDQVLTRGLDGTFAVHGGAALRTLRLPDELGEPNLAASSGVAGLRVLPQGRYLSFTAGGERKLVLGAASARTPQLVQSNGQVERFAVSGDGAVELEVAGLGALTLELAGLPASARCELRTSRRRLSLSSDVTGAVHLQLPEHATGPSSLRCAVKE
ncbi:MAG TPA: endo alpha-1,4 polygalactosaminidase [Polyangiales bacterium]|nr:endo alpha-1,4 polygalactosaminidase [Polyangiales bacterium]